MYIPVWGKINKWGNSHLSGARSTNGASLLSTNDPNPRRKFGVIPSILSAENVTHVRINPHHCRYTCTCVMNAIASSTCHVLRPSSSIVYGCCALVSIMLAAKSNNTMHQRSERHTCNYDLLRYLQSCAPRVFSFFRSSLIEYERSINKYRSMG